MATTTNSFVLLPCFNLVLFQFFRLLHELLSVLQTREKLEENKIKTREQNKGRKSKRCCRLQFTWLIIALLSNRYRSADAPISLRCHSIVAPLSQRYRTSTVPLSLRRCCSVVALLSHRYHTDIPPLSLCCCRSCCCYTVAPLLHRRCAVVEQQLLRTREGINNTILNCCCSTVTQMLLLLSIGRFTRLSPQEA